MLAALLSLISRVTQRLLGGGAGREEPPPDPSEEQGRALERLGELIEREGAPPAGELSPEPASAPSPVVHSPTAPIAPSPVVHSPTAPLAPSPVVPSPAAPSALRRDTPSAAELFASDEALPRGHIIRVGRQNPLTRGPQTADPREGPALTRPLASRVALNVNETAAPSAAPPTGLTLPPSARQDPQGRLVRPTLTPPEAPELPSSGRLLGLGRGREVTQSAAEEASEQLGSAAPRSERVISMEQLRYQSTNAPNASTKNAIGLGQRSASQAALSKEQRLAVPASSTVPSRVESTAYARFWGTYSASDTPLRFTSLLEVEVRLGEDPLLPLEEELRPTPKRPKRLSDEEVWRALLGGRSGFFGDALDLQWVRERFEPQALSPPDVPHAYLSATDRPPRAPALLSAEG